MFALKYDVQAHPMPIYHTSFWDENNSILCLSGDKHISCIDIATGERLPFSINLGKTGYALLVVKNLLWIGCTDGNIHIIDLAAKKEIKNYTLHKAPIFSFQYIPEHNWMIATDGKGVMSIWKAESLLNLSTLPIGKQKIRSTLFDRENKQLLVPSYDGNLYSIDPETLNQQKFNLHNPESSEIYALCKLKTNRFLVGYKNGHLGLASPVGAPTNKLLLPLHNFGIYAILKLGDDIVTCSRDKSIKVWNAEDLSSKQKLDHKNQGHNRSVNGLLRLNQNSFASYGDDGRVKIWQRDL